MSISPQIGLPLVQAQHPPTRQIAYVAHHADDPPADQLLAGEALDTTREDVFLQPTIDAALWHAQQAWCCTGRVVVCRYRVGEAARYATGELCDWRRHLHHEALIGPYRLTPDGWELSLEVL